MRRNVLCLFSFTAFLFMSSHAGAQQAPELNEVVVTATRIESPILESPSLVTVVTRQDIRESGSADLSGVLAAQSGIIINDYGPQGQSKTVSIRGSTASQVLVLVDGLRFNSSFDGSVDLSRIPVANIDHLEILQGGSSSLWGTGAVGGVINVITRKSGTPEITLDVSNGSYIPHDSTAVTESGQTAVPASALSLVDNQNVNLSLVGKLGPLGLTGGGSFTRAANAFTWSDTASLGGWRQRNNAQDLAESAFAGMDVPFLQGTLVARGMFTHSLVGVPGSQTYPSSQASQEDTAVMGSFSYGTSNFFMDSVSLDLKGSYRYAQETYDNPLFPPAAVHTTNAANLDLTQKLVVSDALSAVYGGSGSYELVDSMDIAGPNNRLSLAGFLSLPFIPFESLTITPSVRYDYYSDFPGYLSFQLGTVLALSEESSLRATFATAYRVPTLSDLYWNDGFGTFGNPNLKPETSYSGEVGWALQQPGASLETAVFARLLFDQIEWVYNSVTFTTHVLNITESFLPGLEVHGKIDVAERFSLTADYTFIYSFLLQYPGFNYQLSDNQRVPWVPVHNLSLSVKYKDALNTATLGLQYVGEKTYFDGGTSAWASLAGYLILDAGYAIKTSDALSFSIRLRNILNTLYYTEAGGYPMPPFSVETGMQLHL